jgi:hypothetical protein
MNKAEATKFYLLFNLAIADKVIDVEEYKLLKRYSKTEDFTNLTEEDVDYNSLITLTKEEKGLFYADLVDMMQCDGKITKEELVLCGMIGEVMGADPKKCMEVAERSGNKEINLKDRIAQEFVSFTNAHSTQDIGNTTATDFIKEFFNKEDIELKIKDLKILLFGSNEKLAINSNEIVRLFNETFQSLKIPGEFSSKNFSFHLDTYAAMKKTSNKVFNSVKNNEFDYIIIGSKPHRLVNGFDGSWKQNEMLTGKISKDCIFENHRGFSKSYLKKVISQIGLKLSSGLN